MLLIRTLKNTIIYNNREALSVLHWLNQIKDKDKGYNFDAELLVFMRLREENFIIEYHIPITIY